MIGLFPRLVRAGVRRLFKLFSTVERTVSCALTPGYRSLPLSILSSVLLVLITGSSLTAMASPDAGPDLPVEVVRHIVSFTIASYVDNLIVGRLRLHILDIIMQGQTDASTLIGQS